MPGFYFVTIIMITLTSNNVIVIIGSSTNPEPQMTNTERQQIYFYQRTGLSFLGVTYQKAMQTPAIRTAIECGARASSKGKTAPVQPSLI